MTKALASPCEDGWCARTGERSVEVGVPNRPIEDCSVFEGNSFFIEAQRDLDFWCFFSLIETLVAISEVVCAFFFAEFPIPLHPDVQLMPHHW